MVAMLPGGLGAVLRLRESGHFSPQAPEVDTFGEHRDTTTGRAAGQPVQGKARFSRFTGFGRHANFDGARRFIARVAYGDGDVSLRRALLAGLDHRLEGGRIGRLARVPEQESYQPKEQHTADPRDNELQRVRLVRVLLLARRHHNTSNSAAVAPSTVTRLSTRIICTAGATPVSAPILPNVHSMNAATSVAATYVTSDSRR